MTEEERKAMEWLESVMTEEEAKTKWCPAFRGNAHGVNRPDELKTDAGLGFCVGSACMAWRETFEPVHVDGEFDPGAIIRLQKSGGYCGLAGKP